MLEATNAGFATDHAATHAATAAIFNRPLQARTESGQDLECCDASRLRHLLERRLAWYGLQSVEIGSFRLLTNDVLLVDLLEARGAVLCRVEVDRQSGVIKTSACHTLSRLLTSDRRPTSERGHSQSSVGNTLSGQD
jgi:hypothetical protein